MTRILVTGATGFLGGKLTERLYGLGFDVIATGRNREIGTKFEERGISFIQSDLTNTEDTFRLVESMDYVFHTAALSSPWGKYEDFYSSNVSATKNLLSASQRHNIKRFIHVSTPSLYFCHNEGLNVKEDNAIPPSLPNHYAKTKFMAEQEVDTAFKNGLPVITIRPRALFGPGDKTIIPRLIKVNEKGKIPLVNNGKVLTDITYVENVVDALLLCMDSPANTLGEKYNITNGEPVYLFDVLETLFTELGTPFNFRNVRFEHVFRLASIFEGVHRLLHLEREPLLTKYSVGVLGKNQTLSIEKAKNELGYHPNVSINQGIKEFASWWKGEIHG